MTFTSKDPSVGEGFFAIHVPAATPTVTARRGALAAGYGEDSATLAIVQGATVLVDLALPAGRLRLHPMPLTATLELGTTKTTTLIASNSGTGALQFGLEQTAVEEHFDSGIVPPSGCILEPGGSCDWSLLDPDTSFVSNFAGGDGFAAFVNAISCLDGDATDASLVSLVIDLGRSHTASIGFLLSMAPFLSSVQLDVDISVDGGNWTNIMVRTEPTSARGPGTQVQLDLTPFIGSEDVRVRFHYRAPAAFNWVIIDQVHFFNGVSESAIMDIDPESGVLSAGESRTLGVVFDARAVAQPGIYTVPILVTEDTPYGVPFGDSDARVTVAAPASYGSIGGVISSLGYCDASPRVLGGAKVKIQGADRQTYTATSAADGSYRYWVEAAQGPFTVRVAAANHRIETRQIPVVAGDQADGAFGLRMLQPCLLADPAAPSATLDSGQSLSSEFTLLNVGAAPAEWALHVGGDPDVRSPVPLSQTLSPLPEAGFTVTCAPPGGSGSFANSYMRLYRLADYSLAEREITIVGITFAIDPLTSPESQPVSLRLYSLAGDLRIENLMLLREKTVTIGAGNALQRVSAVFDQPVTVSSTATLVAELNAVAGETLFFFAGGNSGGESTPTYLVAPRCGITEPTSYADISSDLGVVHTILDIDALVKTSCGASATPIDWLEVPQQTGTLAADSGTPLQALFDAAGYIDGTYRGTICLSPGESAARAVVVPVTMQVGKGETIFANDFD